MIDPVERDERNHNGGWADAYYDELDERATELADERIGSTEEVADASDYPVFFSQLTLALNSDNNEARLFWLAAIRDCVHGRIKSAAHEELRKADLAGEEP